MAPTRPSPPPLSLPLVAASLLLSNCMPTRALAPSGVEGDGTS